MGSSYTESPCPINEGPALHNLGFNHKLQSWASYWGVLLAAILQSHNSLQVGTFWTVCLIQKYQHVFGKCHCTSVHNRFKVLNLIKEIGITSVSPFVSGMGCIPKHYTKMLKTYAYVFAEIQVTSWKTHSNFSLQVALWESNSETLKFSFPKEGFPFSWSVHLSYCFSFSKQCIYMPEAIDLMHF